MKLCKYLFYSKRKTRESNPSPTNEALVFETNSANQYLTVFQGGPGGIRTHTKRFILSKTGFPVSVTGPFLTHLKWGHAESNHLAEAKDLQSS